MSETSIIREFLVALGIKADDAKLKKFEEGIEKITKTVIGFASTVEDMAIAVEAAVAKVSSKFEDLYYASQRIGDSVANIRGYTFAIGQMGGTAQGAMAALESMGEFFRSNPAAERYINGLGVQTRDANGQLRAMTGIMSDLGAQFRAMPYYQAKVRAGVLGIDPRTLQAMLRGTDEAKDHYATMAAAMGIDQQAAAKASHDFMNDLRELLAMITLAADKVVLTIQPMARQVVQWLEALHRATGGWSSGVIGLIAVLGPLMLIVDPLVIGIAAIVAAVVAVIAYFSDWRKGLGDVGSGLSDVWDALQPVINAIYNLAGALALTFGPAITAFLNGFFHNLANLLHVVADVIRVVVDLLTGNWSKAWADAKRFGHDALTFLLDDAKSVLHVIEAIGEGAKHAWDWLHGRGAKSPPVAANQNPAPGAPGPAAIAAQGVGAVAGQIASFFQKHGFSAQSAAGITAGAFAESKLNPNAVNPTSGAYGIGQWLGPRKAELFRRYGPHPGLSQQLEFMLSELTGGGQNGRAGANIAGQASALGAMQAYITQFMRPGNGTPGDLGRGQAFLGTSLGQSLASGHGGVSFDQKTEINVYGANDPAATARDVAAQQGRVTNAAVRQLKTVAS